MKFEIRNLSHGQADCFLVVMENDMGDICTILIDGNREGMNGPVFANMRKVIETLDRLDYIVITHVDNDHLGGILSLFTFEKNEALKGEEDTKNEGIADKLKDTKIVYNYITKGEISYKQAEKFEELISHKKIICSCNKHYDSGNQMLRFLSVRQRNILQFKDDMEKRNAYLTFLNPDKSGVNEVVRDYEEYKKRGKKMNGQLVNKNSIVFLLEFCGKRVLFAGDAYWEDIQIQLGQIKNLKSIDLIKIPHHGAYQNNVGIEEGAHRVGCRNFIVTGSEEWDKEHPSEEVLNNLYSKFQHDLKIYTKVYLDSIYGKSEETIDMLKEE